MSYTQASFTCITACTTLDIMPDFQLITERHFINHYGSTNFQHLLYQIQYYIPDYGFYSKFLTFLTAIDEICASAQLPRLNEAARPTSH